MKVKVNTDGAVECIYTDREKLAIANMAALAEESAFYYRNTEFGSDLSGASLTLRMLLNPDDNAKPEGDVVNLTENGLTPEEIESQMD